MKELKSIIDLTTALSKFPSIGTKSAERLAYALLDIKDEDVNDLVKTITNVKAKVHQCPNCGVLTEDPICSICNDPTRDHSICIVISYPKDALAFEEIDQFRGIYHVLNGEISSYHGVTPDKLHIQELLYRIAEENIKEIIIATNPSVEGDTTALYLTKLLEDKNVKVSRIGFGLPVGGKLDYADSLTLKKSLEGRTYLKKDDE